MSEVIKIGIRRGHGENSYSLMMGDSTAHDISMNEALGLIKEEMGKLRKQRASWIPGRESMEDELRLPEWVSKALELMDEVRRAKQLSKLKSGKGKREDKDAKQAGP